MVLKTGLRFSSYVEFKDAVRRYAVQTGADLHHKYNDKMRQRFDCLAMCP